MKITPVRVLMLLVALLSAGLASLWIDTQGHWQNWAWLAPAAKKPDMQPPAGLKLAATSPTAESYASIQERPLFAPDRRPPPPPAPPVPPPPPDPLANLQLRGIFSGEQAGILASIDGKVRRVKVSESVGSWQLKSIDGRQVTFVQGGQTRQIQLSYASLIRVVPPPPAAGAKSAAGSPGAATATDGNPAQRAQDETRDRIRRLNEARAQRGQAPISYP